MNDKRTAYPNLKKNVTTYHSTTLQEKVSRLGMKEAAPSITRVRINDATGREKFDKKSPRKGKNNPKKS